MPEDVVAIERHVPARADALDERRRFLVEPVGVAGGIGRHADVLDADRALVDVVVAGVPRGVRLGHELADARAVGVDDVVHALAGVVLQRRDRRVPAALGVVDDDQVDDRRAGGARWCRTCPSSSSRTRSRPGSRACRSPLRRADLRAPSVSSGCAAIVDGLAVARRERPAGAQDRRRRLRRSARAPLQSAMPESCSSAARQLARSSPRAPVLRAELGEHARAGLGAEVGVGAQRQLVDAHELGAARRASRRRRGAARARRRRARDRPGSGMRHLLQLQAAFDDADGEHQLARHAVAIGGRRPPTAPPRRPAAAASVRVEQAATARATSRARGDRMGGRLCNRRARLGPERFPQGARHLHGRLLTGSGENATSSPHPYGWCRRARRRWER